MAGQPLTKDQRNLITLLRDAAAERGATVNEMKGSGHFQVKGQMLIHYYPFSKNMTAYLDGTTYGRRNVGPREAVAMAYRPPPIVAAEKKDTRSGNSRRIRKGLIRRDGPECHWCRCDLSLDDSTIDHVIPLHRGGLDHSKNRVLACGPCNLRRGHDMPELKGEENVERCSS